MAAFRSRALTKRFPDGHYRPSTLLIIGGLATDALLIEVQTVAEM